MSPSSNALRGTSTITYRFATFEEDDDTVTINPTNSYVFATLCNGFSINNFYEGANTVTKSGALTKLDVADSEAESEEVFSGDFNADWSVNLLGNTMIYNLPEDGTSFTIEWATDDSTAKYYDYYLALDNIPNPETAIPANPDRGDFMDTSENSNTDSSMNLFTVYTQYTYKAGVGVWDYTSTAATSPNTYNAKSYGVLNSAWMGFSDEGLRLLYISPDG